MSSRLIKKNIKEWKRKIVKEQVEREQESNDKYDLYQGIAEEDEKRDEKITKFIEDNMVDEEQEAKDVKNNILGDYFEQERFNEERAKKNERMKA